MFLPPSRCADRAGYVCTTTRAKKIRPSLNQEIALIVLAPFTVVLQVLHVHHPPCVQRCPLAVALPYNRLGDPCEAAHFRPAVDSILAAMRKLAY